VFSPGYMPVQTRAHTFSDTRVAVKLTRPDQKNTLLGYRTPLDAGLPIANDASMTGTPLASPVAPMP
jgi:hypothetical protein